MKEEAFDGSLLCQVQGKEGDGEPHGDNDEERQACDNRYLCHLWYQDVQDRQVGAQVRRSGGARRSDSSPLRPGNETTAGAVTDDRLILRLLSMLSRFADRESSWQPMAFSIVR